MPQVDQLTPLQSAVSRILHTGTYTREGLAMELRERGFTPHPDELRAVIGYLIGTGDIEPVVDAYQCTYY